MNNFQTRVISAIVALSGAGLLYYFKGADGLMFLTTLAVVFSTVEFYKFLDKSPRASGLLAFTEKEALFAICVLFTFVVSASVLEWGTFAAAFSAILLSIVCLIRRNSFGNLEELERFLVRGILGIVYLGIFPAFVSNILHFKAHGIQWMITLLAIVFGGDIGAYAFGMTFGKRKIMPEISPKKSWEGSIGGLVFSMLAAFACSFMLPTIPKSGLIGLAFFAGITAQFGDFFESLLKRVADVKDSGNIMPGHGGVLDRIDGILFASPIVYFGASLLEYYFS